MFQGVVSNPHRTDYFVVRLVKGWWFCCLGCWLTVRLPSRWKSLTGCCPPVKLGLYEQHKHKDKINTKTKRDISSGTCKDKTTRIFLCFVFCAAFGLCTWQSLCRRLASFLYFAFCFVLMVILMLMLTHKPGLS